VIRVLTILAAVVALALAALPSSASANEVAVEGITLAVSPPRPARAAFVANHTEGTISIRRPEPAPTSKPRVTLFPIDATHAVADVVGWLG
jgi:hypothetical protein